MYFRNYRLQKAWLDKCLESCVSENPWTLNVLKGLKHYWNLHSITFIIFFSSICRKVHCRMSLLVICKILGLFVNTLSVDDKYSLCNSDKLLQAIQIQLSKNIKLVLIVLLLFWNLGQILKNLKRKMLPSQLMYFRNYGLQKMWLDKCLRSPASESTT